MELTISEAAVKYPQLSVPRYRQLCQRNILVSCKIAPRLWLIQEDSLRAYLLSSRKPGPRRKA